MYIPQTCHGEIPVSVIRGGIELHGTVALIFDISTGLLRQLGYRLFRVKDLIGRILYTTPPADRPTTFQRDEPEFAMRISTREA